MKVLIKVILSAIVLVTVSIGVLQSRLVADLKIDDECKIPNQNKTRGLCVRRRDCADYEELFNVEDLGIERLSFILNLDCGFDYDSWSSLVCCPKPGNSYKQVQVISCERHLIMKKTAKFIFKFTNTQKT